MRVCIGRTNELGPRLHEVGGYSRQAKRWVINRPQLIVLEAQSRACLQYCALCVGSVQTMRAGVYLPDVWHAATPAKGWRGKISACSRWRMHVAISVNTTGVGPKRGPDILQHILISLRDQLTCFGALPYQCLVLAHDPAIPRRPVRF